MPPATASSRGAFWLVRESEQQTYCHLLGVPCRRHVGQRGSPEGGVEPRLGHLGRLPGGREARAESWRQSRGTGQEGKFRVVAGRKLHTRGLGTAGPSGLL